MTATATFINAVLNAAFAGGTYTGTTIRMKLFTGNLPSAGGTEVTGGSYSSQILTFSAASAKKINTSSNATFTNLPTSQTIVSYGVYDGATLIDEKLLDTPFTADVNTNTLQISYSFEIGT